jgi:hypothetical protein
MLHEMDRHRVSTLVLSPHKALVIPDCNLETVPILAESEGRFLGYWVVHPHGVGRFEREIKLFENHRRDGFVGFKFHSSLHDYPLDGPLCEPWWAYANEHRLLVLAHTWGGDGRCGLANCRKVAERYPEVRFILGHSGYQDYEHFALLARDHANVYLDTCAVGCLNGAIEGMARIAGASKVVFGTDLPWFDPAYLMGAVKYSRISESDRLEILGGNAARLLAPLRPEALPVP